MSTTTCRAKDPAACRVHGRVLSPQLEAFVREWGGLSLITHDTGLFHGAGRIRKGLNPFLRQQNIDWALREQLRNKHGANYQALGGYMRHDYEFVNAHLRGDAAWREFVTQRSAQYASSGYHDFDEAQYRARARDAVEKIDKLFEDLGDEFTSDEAVLYRFETPFAGRSVEQSVATYEPGMIVDAPAYTSTSLDPNAVLNVANDPSYPDDFYVFEILSKRGVEVHRIAGGMGDEHEVLLSRGSKFQVHRVTEASYTSGLNWEQQRRRGYFGTMENPKRGILKKRFKIVQLIDVTED